MWIVTLGTRCFLGESSSLNQEPMIAQKLGHISTIRLAGRSGIYYIYQAGLRGIHRETEQVGSDVFLAHAKVIDMHV